MPYLVSNATSKRVLLVIAVQEASTEGCNVKTSCKAQIYQVEGRKYVATDAFLLVSLKPILTMEHAVERGQYRCKKLVEALRFDEVLSLTVF